MQQERIIVAQRARKFVAVLLAMKHAERRLNRVELLQDVGDLAAQTHRVGSSGHDTRHPRDMALWSQKLNNLRVFSKQARKDLITAAGPGEDPARPTCSAAERIGNKCPVKGPKPTQQGSAAVAGGPHATSARRRVLPV